jgi:Fructose-1,6-bisphosphate aldolase
VDALDVQAGHETYQRFDRFNKKYNPFSQTDLREIFLKSDNYIGGRYLAEITKEVFMQYAENKYEFSELRISIYGNNDL